VYYVKRWVALNGKINEQKDEISLLKRNIVPGERFRQVGITAVIRNVMWLYPIIENLVLKARSETTGFAIDQIP
jgi:hypothetical protein